MEHAGARTKHVLLVEDDEDICRLLAKYLEARQFQMHPMADGEQAWEAFQRQPFDLVLTDVMMPRLSGLELVARIREHPRGGAIPVILVSAAIPDERQVQRLKVTAALRKPIPLRELLGRMEEALALTAGRRTDRLAAIQEKAAAFGKPITSPGEAQAPAFGKPVTMPGAVPPPAFGKVVTNPGAVPPPAFGKPVTKPGAVLPPAFGKVATNPGAAPPRPVSQPGAAVAPASVGNPGPLLPPPVAVQVAPATPLVGPSAKWDAPPPLVPPAEAFGRPVSLAGVPMAPVVLRASAATTPTTPRPSTVEPAPPSQPPPTNEAAAGVMVPWSSTPVVLPTPLQGDASLPALALALMTLFERRATAVLRVQSPGALWSIHLVDGLVVDARTTHARGSLARHLQDVRLLAAPAAPPPVMPSDQVLLTAASKHTGIPAPECACVQQYAAFVRRVVGGALVSATGRFAVVAWDDNPVLGTRTVLDPLDLVARTCLDEVSQEDAVRLLVPVRARQMVPAEAFQERSLVLLRHRPAAQFRELLQHGPTVEVALSRLQAQPGGANARELLALIVLQAVTLETAGPPPSAPKRPTVLASLESPWVTPAVSLGAVAVRQVVARAWLETFGMDAFGTLGLSPLATQQDVDAAAARWQDTLGPPTLDNADLGPAKVYLAVLRRRRDEALRLLADPGQRNVYRGWLADRVADNAPLPQH